MYIWAQRGDGSVKGVEGGGIEGIPIIVYRCVRYTEAAKQCMYSCYLLKGVHYGCVSTSL